MHQLSLKKMTGLGELIALQDLLASIFSSDEAVILATPMSSIGQLILCLGFMMILKRREKQ